MMHQTERLILRRFQDDDFPDFYTFMSDPRLGKWLDKPNGLTKEQALAMMKRLQNTWHVHNYGPFAVIEKTSDQLIGYCGIKYVDRFQLPEVLYGLHPDHWGQGFITEGCKKALEIAEKEWRIEKVIAYTLPNNLASESVMKKLGMKYTKNIIHANLDHVFYERDLMLLSD